MEFLMWFIIVLLFTISLAGVVIPLIPDTLPLWAGFLLYQFTMASHALPSSFWWGAGAITLLIVGADILANLFFVKKYGGSRYAMVGAAIGLLLGPFILGPVGILLGPFAAVIAIEWIMQKEWNKALRAAWGTVIALFSGAVAKIILQTIMIIWFFIVI